MHNQIKTHLGLGVVRSLHGVGCEQAGGRVVAAPVPKLTASTSTLQQLPIAA